MSTYITVKTLNDNGDNERNVTLACHEDGDNVLLGVLPHYSKIVVDQELIDALQKIVGKKDQE